MQFSKLKSVLAQMIRWLFMWLRWYFHGGILVLTTELYYDISYPYHCI